MNKKSLNVPLLEKCWYNPKLYIGLFVVTKHMHWLRKYLCEVQNKSIDYKNDDNILQRKFKKDADYFDDGDDRMMMMMTMMTDTWIWES